jgi:hypothetical protein
MTIQMCDFAKRQYRKDFGGTKVTPEIVEKLIEMSESPVAEFSGYADFCKIVALSNRSKDGTYLFESLKCLTVNKKEALKFGATLHTDYESRTTEELPILVEWVTGLETPTAEFIHLILYSKEQMNKEEDPVEADWAIVSIGTASTVEVEPMRPITAMRNALGVEEGGSGVSIDREEYSRSSKFWSENIMIRD